MENLYTISEVADKLGLSTKTLRRWEETGKFRSTRTLGGQRRYSLADLQILDAIKHGAIPSSRDLLTITQAAALFGVSEITINRWEEEGKIHPLITAGVTYYPKHRLLEKIQPSSPTPKPEPQPTPQYPEFTQVPVTPPVTQPIIPTYVARETKRLDSPPAKTKKLHIEIPAIPTQVLYTSINIAITFLMLLTYHLLVNRNNVAPRIEHQGSVQGTSTTRDDSLTLLDSILDKSGNIHTTSVSSSLYTLLPAAPPSKPTPGTLYMDAGSQSLKFYTSGGWADLTPNISSLKSDSSITGSADFAKGQNSATVDIPGMMSGSTVILTFTSDIYPSTTYWITKKDGSFTVHTDKKLLQNVSFDYLVGGTKAQSQSPTITSPVVR